MQLFGADPSSIGVFSPLKINRTKMLSGSIQPDNKQGTRRAVETSHTARCGSFMLQLDGIQPGDGVKAEGFPGLTGRLTGSMMELQTLQEALKVEIQIHQKLVAQMKQDPQNADLKKQLHELQAKITALSEKQKKVVEQLRKELLVKQEPEAKLQLQVQSAAAGVDVKQHSLLQIAPSQQVLHQPTLSPSQTPTGLQQTLTVTPVLTAKTLPLVLKAAAAPTLPTSVLPQRPTAVAMVTTAITKPDSQSAPINLQMASKLTNVQSSEPVRLVSKNAMMVQATTTTSSSAPPIKVPQFVPPPRLTPRPTFQPQVRPKPATPNNNVPIAPAPPPPMMAAPQLLQRPLMLTTKLAASSLPSSAGPIHQVRIVNGQPCVPAAISAKTQQAPGALTGIVIATPVSAAATRLATPIPAPTPTTNPTRPLQVFGLASDAKTVKAPGGPEQKAFVSVTSSSTPPLSPASRPKKEENPQKLAFMVSLGLVTHDHLEEIQSRRQERKRRTTANPVYSGAVFEPERKKSAVTYLNTPLHQGTRKRGRPPKYTSSVPELGSHTPTSPSSGCCPSGSPAPSERPDAGSLPYPVYPHTLPLPSPSSGDGDIHEDFCTVCRRSGQLLMCDTCSRVYHLDCLDPPLKTIPKGMWICPKCQDQILKKEEAIPWPGTLAIVHSYIAYKEAKEEEKQKLMKWSTELKLEREQLEQRVKQLSNSITKCMETKNTILARQKEMQVSLEKVKHLIRLIQAFNFNQALIETECPDATAEEDISKVRDAVVPIEKAVVVVSPKTGAEASSEPGEKVKDAVATQNSSSSNNTTTTTTEGREKEEEEEEEEEEAGGRSTQMGVGGIRPEAAGDIQAQSVSEDSAVLAATAAVANSSDEPVIGVQSEVVTQAETEAAAVADTEDTSSIAVANTNGTSEQACPDGSVTITSTGSCTDTTTTNSENNNRATTNSTEEASEKKPEEISNSDGSSSNNNNNKTSETSQHSLPARLNSLDNKK